MRGLREHIRDASSRESITLLVHQHRRISRQGGGITRDVDDSPGRILRQRLHDGDSTLTRWIDEELVEMAECRNALGSRFKKIRNVELAAFGQPVQFRVL